MGARPERGHGNPSLDFSRPFSTGLPARRDPRSPGTTQQRAVPYSPTVTDFSRDKPVVGATPLARGVAVVSLILGLSGALFWVPALFLPRPEVVTHDWMTFIQRVANVALQQYTPNMRPVVPVLGALFTVVSVFQVFAAAGAWSGQDRALAILRIVSYAKIGLFVISALLLGLAVFSSVDRENPPWTLTASSWVATLVFVGIYYSMIRAINRILGDNLDPDAGVEESDEDDLEDDDGDGD